MERDLFCVAAVKNILEEFILVRQHDQHINIIGSDNTVKTFCNISSFGEQKRVTDLLQAMFQFQSGQSNIYLYLFARIHNMHDV